MPSISGDLDHAMSDHVSYEHFNIPQLEYRFFYLLERYLSRGGLLLLTGDLLGERLDLDLSAERLLALRRGGLARRFREDLTGERERDFFFERFE